jgi:dihydroorotate dehydrogenase
VSLFDIATGAVRILPAETAHRFTINSLKTGLAKPSSELDDPRLGVTLKKSGLRLPNPIGLAAGFDKNAEVFAQMLAFGFGFAECGTVTPRPQAGNPRPRLFRLTQDQAVINRMGFNNEGIGMFVRRLSAAPRSIGVIGANVGAGGVIGASAGACGTSAGLNCIAALGTQRLCVRPRKQLTD